MINYRKIADYRLRRLLIVIIFICIIFVAVLSTIGGIFAAIYDGFTYSILEYKDFFNGLKSTFKEASKMLNKYWDKNVMSKGSKKLYKNGD